MKGLRITCASVPVLMGVGGTRGPCSEPPQNGTDALDPRVGLRVELVPASSHHLHGVLERINDAFPVFNCRLFAAWQIDHKASAALHTHCTRKHCARRDLQAVIAHGLGDAWYFSVAHSTRGFRCYVAQRKSASAAGEHDVYLQLICCAHDFSGYLCYLVFHDNVRRAVPSLIANQFFQGGTCCVLRQIAGVRAGDDCKR